MKPIDVAKAALSAPRRWARDRRGAIAPMFAIAIIPLILAGGIGIDIARLVASRNSMQDALDATTLALGREPAGTPIATLNTKARAWMTANLTDKNLDPNAVTLTLTQGSGTLQLDATSSVATTVSSIAGVTALPFQAHSTVKWGLSHVELVLVLDNTGSMADDNKLQSLKDAATKLVDTLYTSASQSGDPEALKVGVVPFSIAVNVGAQYRTADWITGVQPAAYGAGTDIFNTANVDRFALLDAMNVKWGGCVEDRPMPYDVKDDPPIPGNGATMFVPFFAPDESDEGVVSGQKYGYGNDYLNDAAVDTTTAWNATNAQGIKGWKARQGNAAKYTHAPDRTGQAALSPYPVGPNAGCGIAPILRMTKDISQVKTKLTEMVAYGNTHIPLGLIWGWHLLSPSAPFMDGKPYGTPNVVKIVVLVTDGANTYALNSNNQVCGSGNNLYYCTPDTDDSNYTGLGYAWQNRIARGATANGNGDFSRPDLALNDRLKVLCSNMLAQGITMYTVPLEVTDTNIKSLLQGCASSPANYIDVSDSTKLQAAFTNIAGSIGNLRVAH